MADSKAEWLRRINDHPELLGGFETLEEVVKCLEELDDLNGLLIEIESSVMFCQYPMATLSKLELLIQEHHKKYPKSSATVPPSNWPNDADLEVGVKPEDMTPKQQALYLLIRELTAYIGPYETSTSWNSSGGMDGLIKADEHPIHKAVVEVQKHYPHNRLPQGLGWWSWVQLLRYSRGHIPQKSWKLAQQAYYWAQALRQWAMEEMKK